MLKLAFPSGDSPTGRNDGRLFGTWDFKWRAGEVIDVAFLQPRAELVKALVDHRVHFEGSAQETEFLGDTTGVPRLTRIIELLARRWLQRPANIEFKFDHELFPRDRAKWPAERRYDVLVSLDDLPLTRPEAKVEGVKPLRFFLPSSELGRYSQRIDYGNPTVYLGKRQYWSLWQEPERTSSREYFDSPEFTHWVIHEFGHVLGLPHEHQNPHINRQIRRQLLPVSGADPSLVGVLRHALGYPANLPEEQQEITPLEINQEIRTAWETMGQTPEGDFRFCDFRRYRKSDDVTDDSSSIMFHVYWQRLLRSRDPQDQGERSQRHPDAPPNFHRAPTGRDLAVVTKMYPPRPRLARRQDDQMQALAK
jgi:hypothetical protein